MSLFDVPEATAGHARAVARLLGLPRPAWDGTLPVVVAEPPTRLPPAHRAAWWRDLPAPEGGLAVVPVDVRPGWHGLLALREQADLHGPRVPGTRREAGVELARLARRHAAGADTPWLAWLDAVVAAHEADAPWAALLDVPDVWPATLLQLDDEASAAGLGWLLDARLATSSFATLSASARAWAEDEARRAGRRIRGEQVADLCRNQLARVGLWWRGPALPQLGFDRDAALATTWAGTTPAWSRWALEPLDDLAEITLSDADAPPTAAAVARAAAGRALDPDALADAVAEGLARAPTAQELVDGVLAAWELGFVRPLAPDAGA